MCVLCAAEGTLQMKVSDNYSATTYLLLMQSMWVLADSMHPIPSDGVEASEIYHDVAYTTVEQYLTQLAQTI